MNLQELRPDQASHSHWRDKLNTPASMDIPRAHLREKILEEDRKKRNLLLFSTFFIIASITIVISLFSFKANLLDDSLLVDNIDLLASKEDIEFYEFGERYQWLGLIAEKNQ